MATMARAASTAALLRPRPRLRSSQALTVCCCRYASTTSTPNPTKSHRGPPHLSNPRDVAVLGGGLTGLVTAYYLAALLPLSCKITLYESSVKTGGWFDSHQIHKKNTVPVVSEDEIELRGHEMILEEELQQFDQKKMREARLREARERRGLLTRTDKDKEDEDDDDLTAEERRDYEREHAEEESTEMEAVRQILADRRAVHTKPIEILEGGPRMVAPQTRSTRFDDLLFLELVDDLELLNALRVSEKQHAQYIYYPDRLVNMKMSSNMPQLSDFFDNTAASGAGPVTVFNYTNAMIKWVSHCLTQLLVQPLFRGVLFKTIFHMCFPSREKQYQRDLDTAATMRAPGRLPPDISVGDYFERLTGGRQVSDNMLGALMHGIYGGDVWKLSIASSPFRGMWLARGTGDAFRAWAQRARIEALRASHRARGLLTPRPPTAAETEDDKRALAEWERNEAEFFQGQGSNAVISTTPLTPETQILAKRYTDERPSSVAMESDMAMLRDLLARQLEIYEEHRGFPTNSGGNPAVRFGRLAEASTKWTTMTFANEHGGFGAMTRALTELLLSKTNVTIKTNTQVTGIELDKQSQFVKVTSQNVLTGPASVPAKSDPNKKFPSAPPPPKATHALYDRVVSAFTAPTLSRLTNGVLPSLRQEHAVTIQVVNLYYEDHPNLHHPHTGFGYLIPSTVPLEENPEAALGVIFDSDREQSLRPLREEEFNGNDTPEAFEEWERFKLRENRKLNMRRERQERKAAQQAAREVEARVLSRQKKQKETTARKKTKEEEEEDAELEKNLQQMGYRDIDDFARKNVDDEDWTGPGRGDRGDRLMRPSRYEQKPGAKFTVMFGGHYWDGFRTQDYPSEEEAIARAEAVLYRHLRNTDAKLGPNEPKSLLGSSSWKKRPRPTATRVKLCRECIPQHDVGHAKRMAEVDRELRKEFNGRLAVAGGSFTATGPGVLPSIRSAWDMALRVSGRGYLMQTGMNMYLGGDLYTHSSNQHNGGPRDGMTTMAHVGDTGLARFSDPTTDPVIPVIKKALPFRYGNPTTLREFGAWTVTVGNEDKVVLGEGEEQEYEREEDDDDER